MPGCCTIDSDHEGDRTVFRVAGTFDGVSAAELHRKVDGEPGDLVLDFSRVLEFGDLGVATLAHALAGADRRLVLRGLAGHQLRMFRYFGVNVEPSPAGCDERSASFSASGSSRSRTTPSSSSVPK